jgi:hypothetical protein
MFIRSRPLMGAAVVGGVAHRAGRRGAQAQQEAGRNAEIEELQARQAIAAPSGGGSFAGSTAELEQPANPHGA